MDGSVIHVTHIPRRQQRGERERVRQLYPSLSSRGGGPNPAWRLKASTLLQGAATVCRRGISVKDKQCAEIWCPGGDLNPQTPL